MNIDNKRGRSRGFFNSIAPYATAASGAALGFIAGGPMGAITGGKLGYELGKGNTDKFIDDASGGFISKQKQREMSKDMSGETMYTLPYTNKRKRE